MYRPEFYFTKAPKNVGSKPFGYEWWSWLPRLSWRRVDSSAGKAGVLSLTWLCFWLEVTLWPREEQK